MTSVQPQPQAETSYRAGLASTRSADPFEGLEQAGWSDTDRIKVGDGPFQTLSWGNLRTLLAAYREKLGRCFTVAPDAAMRNAWMGEPLPYDGSTIRSAKVDSPIRLAEPEPDVAFRVLLLGDTGDASQAQAAVARQVTGRGRNVGACLPATDVAAVLIESDLVYPAGAGGEYGDKFFRPYAELLDSQVPIYAVPGNHDWNDGSLIGFMSTFCGVADVPESVRAARSTAIKSRYKALLKIWRNGSAAPTGRPSPSGDDPDKRQPGPYYALDVGGALFIGIDTGYADTIDIEQARWLVRMVERRPEMPKVLFSGKPLIVNGLRAPCRFTG